MSVLLEHMLVDYSVMEAYTVLPGIVGNGFSDALHPFLCFFLYMQTASSIKVFCCTGSFLQGKKLEGTTVNQDDFQ